MALAAEGPKGRCKVARAREATRPLAGVVAGLQARSAKLTLLREMCAEAAMKAPGPTPKGQLAVPERLSLEHRQRENLKLTELPTHWQSNS